MESVLLGHPTVADVCVFPVPHQTLGQEVVAAVVLKSSHELDEAGLLGMARERLATFKVPRKILSVREFPRTAGGKLQRAKMAQLLGLDREVVSARQVGEHGGRSRTALETAVGALWASMLEGHAVDPDEDFFLLGGDSLRAVTLLGQVQEVFGVKLPLAAILDEASTVSGMARCIELSRKSLEASVSRLEDDAAPSRGAMSRFPVRYRSSSAGSGSMTVFTRAILSTT